MSRLPADSNDRPSSKIFYILSQGQTILVIFHSNKEPSWGERDLMYAHDMLPNF